jgi:CubicO group peptidase (beta-lactamase class C family)
VALATCASATPADLASFFDSTVPARLQQDHAPGAVVSVVDHDSQLFAKGYGLADTARDVAFDPDRSLVRIASISKLFTYTAVMQQVQAGRIDLKADVNTYLTSFKIPATYPQPVTVEDLLDHTAGFEDRIIGTGARAASDVPPLGQYLADNMPDRSGRPARSTPTPTTAPHLPGTSCPRSPVNRTTPTSSITCSTRCGWPTPPPPSRCRPRSPATSRSATTPTTTRRRRSRSSSTR